MFNEANNQQIVDNEIITVQGVHGYIGQDQIAYVNLEDAAKGLGITKTDKKGGAEYTRVNRQALQKWLSVFGILNSEKEELPEFIPEPIFYLLAMKADNDTARAFQYKIAYDILPTIRKQGYYSAIPNAVLLERVKKLVELEDGGATELIHTLQESNIDHSEFLCKYVGIDSGAYTDGDEIAAHLEATENSRPILKKWELAQEQVFTVEDLPDELRYFEPIQFVLGKLSVRKSNYGLFANNFGKISFTIYGYKKVIAYGLKNKLITKKDARDFVAEKINVNAAYWMIE